MPRKHTTLTLQKKCDILKELDSGKSLSELARLHSIGKSTICDIKRKRKSIEEFVSCSDAGAGKRRALRMSENLEVENALFTWFLQERSGHTPLSGELICEKAKFFYSRITGREDFKASQGWLEKFKKRHGIRQLTISGEKLSADVSAVEPFKLKFLKKIEEMNLVPDQVYNADESGLFWRVLRNKTLGHAGENTAPGRKMSKVRITFMPCSNASGSHKIKLLVIGKSNKPRAFKTCQNLPVFYKEQKKGWVTREIFLEWFHNDFIPDVRKK
ncbi:hypothetical protein WA026_019057 [Henosepilachna vigintioctopunctata]|uniref:HTH CENPB-type domain-containing protein n=1 Tax=Henosepilachna vigintioctopunctata TaxID=420089 RepID=A0AAW1VC35_9CUCU